MKKIHWMISFKNSTAKRAGTIQLADDATEDETDDAIADAIGDVVDISVRIENPSDSDSG